MCGYFDNDDGTNDFTSCNENGTVIYSSEGVSNFRTMTSDAWTNTHDFADSCCYFELDNEFLGRTECPDTDEENVVRLPDEDCLDLAAQICETAWEVYCTECDQGELDEETFIESCEFDVCGAAEGDLTGIDFNGALSNGYLDTSISKCDVDCNLNDDGSIDTPDPTDSPTPDPTVDPSACMYNIYIFYGLKTTATL